ncbi:MAG: bifunctional phosphoribosylaminoimidazolecarboxamide formyltransferase/IMP cyclohydrolase, partial [Saprospiraceae bacterium]|nr:bifunctional phosphoribosylaminoimidazolecarboxamide formyltransferase/IMP cyclohydrolase [Saprospiraceae bacterium]
MKPKQIHTALISVFHKEGLDQIIPQLVDLEVEIYSTGGTQRYIEEMELPVHAVEELTTYPSILGGRVKTLHPKVFGGILARREDDHQAQLAQYEIPEFDLVIVDLYPFEETIAKTAEEAEIIEKIDIGGISLIRAAAKNYQDVLVIPSRTEYSVLLNLIQEKKGYTDLVDRKAMATKAFQVSAHYDRVISEFFAEAKSSESFFFGTSGKTTLRYGENPHQGGAYFGDLDSLFEILGGKALSYNNLVDIDAAVMLMKEFRDGPPTFAVLKHTNACGVAIRSSVYDAWTAALAGDPVSAFGGILICNKAIDVPTAQAINEIFYEVLVAPGFEAEALKILQKKKKRILLRI